MKIGVLCGGISSERAISLKSGQAVYRALLDRGSDVAFIDITSQEMARDEIRSAQIDVAFIALHGLFGEDGGVQTLLEELAVPYTGSGVIACRRAMDKVQAKTLFQKNGIPTPSWNVVKGDEPNRLRAYPVVVKPRAQGSSIGTGIVRSVDEWASAQAEALRFGSTCLVEDYVTGDEMTIGILNERTLPAIRLRPKEEFYNFRAKYEAGLVEYEVPAKIDSGALQKANERALGAHRALGCAGFSRVDMIVDSSGEPWVLEVNTVPGLMDKSLLPKAAAAGGIPFDELIVRIIKLARTHPKTLFRREIVPVAAEPKRREAPRTRSGTQAEGRNGAGRQVRL